MRINHDHSPACGFKTGISPQWLPIVGLILAMAMPVNGDGADLFDYLPYDWSLNERR